MPRQSDTRRIVVGAVLLGSILAGCSDIYYDRRETVSFAAGDAVAAAQATQVIDPWPPASANRGSLTNGPRVAGAIERYRTGNIIQPQASATSSSAGYGAGVQTQQGGSAPAASGTSSSASQ